MRKIWVLLFGIMLSLLSVNLSDRLNIRVSVPGYKAPEPSAEVQEVWGKIERKEVMSEKESRVLDEYIEEAAKSRKSLNYDTKVVTKLIRNATLPWMAALWLIILFFLIRKRMEAIMIMVPPIIFGLLGFIHVYELLVVVCCGLIIYIYKSLRSSKSMGS